MAGKDTKKILVLEDQMKKVKDRVAGLEIEAGDTDKEIKKLKKELKKLKPKEEKAKKEKAKEESSAS